MGTKKKQQRACLLEKNVKQTRTSQSKYVCIIPHLLPQPHVDLLFRVELAKADLQSSWPKSADEIGEIQLASACLRTVRFQERTDEAGDGCSALAMGADAER